VGLVVRVGVGGEVAGLVWDLLGCGVDAFLVGGFVRDWLLGRESKDVDVVVNDFERAYRCLRERGYDVDEVGAAFRVIKVFLPSLPEPVDVAGFRKETYDYVSRKPIVAPVNSIEEDLGRRDFTINAMAIRVLGVDKDNGVIIGELVDPFRGLEDLRRGVVRCVGDCRVRFLEDPLRMLRALRFAVKTGFELDDSVVEAIRELRDELRRVSIERIRDEVLKCLQYGASRCVELMLSTGLLEIVFPDLFEVEPSRVRHDYRAHHRGETLIEHVLDALRNLERIRGRPTIEEILAVLLHDLGKQVTMVERGGKVMFPRHDEVAKLWVERVLRRLKIPAKSIKRIATAVAAHMKLNNIISQGAPRASLAKWFVWDMGEDLDAAQLAVSIAEADAGRPYPEIRRMLEEFASTPRAVTGLDLIALGVPENLRGYVLKKLREMQLGKNMPREQLLKLAKGIAPPPDYAVKENKAKPSKRERTYEEVTN